MQSTIEQTNYNTHPNLLAHNHPMSPKHDKHKNSNAKTHTGELRDNADAQILDHPSPHKHKDIRKQQHDHTDAEIHQLTNVLSYIPSCLLEGTRTFPHTDTKATKQQARNCTGTRTQRAKLAITQTQECTSMQARTPHKRIKQNTNTHMRQTLNTQAQQTKSIAETTKKHTST